MSQLRQTVAGRGSVRLLVLNVSLVRRFQIHVKLFIWIPVH